MTAATQSARGGVPLRFFGGLAGALAPFGFFLAGVAWLGISGAPDERGFWPILLAALGVGTALARDRQAYAETVVRGMSQPLVGLMILAWMLAGVLASLLTASGFLESLVWLAESAGLAGGAYVAAAFLVACGLSTATGTSLGTLILAVPLLYPAGAQLHASPPVLLAALLAGATFGDNLSPVSDTTIASATTQGASMGRVVASRLRYALPSAAVALVLFALLGGGDGNASAATTPANPVAAPLGALAMIAAPVLVFALLLRGHHLVVGMLAGVAASVAIGLTAGRFQVGDLLRVDPDAFVARGLLADGIERAVGVSVFTLLLMGLTAGVEATGVLERLLEVAKRRATTPRQSELWIFGATSAAVLLTTHSAVAILTVGPFARDVGSAQGLAPERRANLLDVTVCTYPFLLPYFIPTILASSLSANAAGMPRVSALEVGVLNFHSWALLAALLFFIATGIGRDRGSPG